MTTLERAQDLRQTMSPPERILWNALSGRKMDGFKFRRQHPLEPYVLDFYCPEKELCIEVDGWGHNMGDQPERDVRRDAFLKKNGIRTLRISASDISTDMDAVLYTIAMTVRG
ncbi:MAG: endonuclease domain-containing protein [Pseudomonadota bacterium]